MGQLPVIENILQRRNEAATLLRFSHYAAFSLATKMARSAEEVRSFSKDWQTTACRSHARSSRRSNAPPVGGSNAWDVPFFAEALQRKLHDISDEELRPYFPLPRVLDGLFASCRPALRSEDQ